MSLPNVNIIYLPSQVALQAQDFSNIPCVIGPSSAGTNNQIYTISQMSDLDQVGYGPGTDLAAQVLAGGQTQLYFCKSNSTNAGTISSVTKVIGHPVGAPTTIGAGNSSIIFTALTTGLSVTITQQMGMSLAPTATFVAGLLTINLGTDAMSNPNSTPNAIVTLLNGVGGVSAAMTYVAGGTGLGIMVAAMNTPLPFGSNGTATASGVPTDATDMIVKVVTAGTVGSAAPPIVAWSYDGDTNNFTPAFVVPTTGIVPLKDGNFDTGVSLTMSGSFDVGDEFLFTTTAPASSISDIITALNMAIADNQILFGHFQIVGSMSRANATLIDTALEAVKGIRFLQAMIHTRDIAEGVPGETTAQWQTAISLDYAGFNSFLIAVFAGSGNFENARIRRIQRQPVLFGEGPNRAAAPVHESIGLRELYALVKSPVDGKYVYYDEAVTPGLDSQRFIVARSFQGQPGVYKCNRGYTMSDPTHIGYDRTDYVNIIMSSAKIAYDNLFDELMQKVDTIAIAESNSVPAGAISKSAASRIETKITASLQSFWLKPKSDGNTSANNLTNPVTVLRNYSLAATRELRLLVTCYPKATIESVTVFVSVTIPQ